MLRRTSPPAPLRKQRGESTHRSVLLGSLPPNSEPMYSSAGPGGDVKNAIRKVSKSIHGVGSTFFFMLLIHGN
jgi:hypothetical protein